MNHPSSLLPWLATAVFVALIVRALSSGAIGGRSKRPLFSRKDQPLDYWIAVGVVTCFAVGMFSVALLQ